MAKSYFNQLLHGAGQGAALTPLRPAASLWKTAQIEAAAGQNSETAAVKGRRGSATRRSRMVDVGQPVPGQPVAPDPLDTLSADNLQSGSAGEIAPEAWPPSRIRPGVVALSPPASPHGMKRARGSGIGEISNYVPTAAATASTGTARWQPPESRLLPALETDGPAASGGELLAEPATSGAAGVLAPARRATSGFSREPRSKASNAPLSAAPDEGERSAPARRDRRVAPSAPAAGHAQAAWAGARGEHASQLSPTALPVPELPSSAAREPQSASAQRTASTRSREQHLVVRQGSTAETPRSPERGPVQIGKIEVQIVPPPVTSVRPSPPIPPKDRLARGYALWPGW